MASSSHEKWNIETQSWRSGQRKTLRILGLYPAVGCRWMPSNFSLRNSIRLRGADCAQWSCCFWSSQFSALIYFGVTALTGPKGPPPFQDLGAGISSADGLRGDLTTRWVGHPEYQLKFQALNPYRDWAFSYVVAHPPRRLSFHIRLLDSTGFVLCSKEIVFPDGPARVEVIAVPFPELIPKTLA